MQLLFTAMCWHATTAGNRNGGWSVELPAEEVPPELPEPCLGVNFARDGMARKDWLALVAVHSDAWLMAVSFFYAVKLDAIGRCVQAVVSAHCSHLPVYLGACADAPQAVATHHGASTGQQLLLREL
jgi:hypothetical protein